MSSLIGAAVVRTDAESKVRGEAVYGVDYSEVGMLYGKLLRSPVPAGLITVLDTKPALRIPGVHSVLTAADAPVARAGAVVRDQPLFADSLVRYEGEPIAGVVADSEAAARRALDEIILEIESLPAAGDLETATAPNAALVHPDADRY